MKHFLVVWAFLMAVLWLGWVLRMHIRR
ncbi:hypothetical protein CKS_0390 [Pantoea stewartii subsp. stewartii DC283]|uniref:Uncharacterized protein n=1 Tax=Pantoea stewartii subsp. stewartii DC283 TaxID=660596 RepID=H3R9Q8_PANSE|nr:hypothetical protein CKS_0390 [Pantoea stewartii subsp. stewartii DC283]